MTTRLKFAVGIIQRVYEDATVYIEADTEEEAVEKALQKARDGEITWDFLECDNDYPYNVVSTTKIRSL